MVLPSVNKKLKVTAISFVILATSLNLTPAFAQQSYAEKGAEQLNKGNYTQAIESLKRAIDQNSDDAPSVYNRAQAYRQNGQNKEAITDYSRYLELAPSDPESHLVYYNRGLSYHSLGQYDNAIADFSQVVELKPDYTAGYIERARAYLDSGVESNRSPALSDANKAVQMAGSDARAYIVRGLVYSAQGDLDSATRDFDKSISLDSSAANYTERGNFFLNNGQYDKAIQDFDKSLAKVPNDANVLYNRGLANKRRDQFKAAVEDLSKSLQAAPNDPVTLLERARCKVYIPDYKGALEDFSKSIELDDNPVARFERAEINMKMKLPEPALQDLNTAISKGNPTPNMYALRALAHARLSDFNKANSDLQSADSLYSMANDDEKQQYIESQAYAALAQILLGKSGEASQMAQKALDLGGANLNSISKAMLTSARSLANARMNKGSLASTDASNAKSLSSEWGDLSSFLGGGSITTTAPSSASGTTSGDINKPVKDKWALVIGVSDFKDGTIPKLKYSAKDARDFRDFLVKKANFSPDHVRLLVNKDATRMRIISELGEKFLPRVAQEDDLVVIYFSSHGSPSSADDIGGNNYFVAYDTEKTNLFASGIDLQDLMKLIKKRVRTNRVVVILDACHSGGADANAKAMDAAANFDASQLMGQGQLVICSSEASERSYESKRYQNGVFTKMLMEGLTARGSNTRLKDAFEILRTKVNNEVQEDDGQRQTPVLKSQWDGDDVSLALPSTQPRQIPALVKQMLLPDSSFVAPKK